MLHGQQAVVLTPRLLVRYTGFEREKWKELAASAILVGFSLVADQHLRVGPNQAIAIQMNLLHHDRDMHVHQPNALLPP